MFQTHMHLELLCISSWPFTLKSMFALLDLISNRYMAIVKYLAIHVGMKEAGLGR
jgi:hypothetical protein